MSLTTVVQWMSEQRQRTQLHGKLLKKKVGSAA